MPAKRRPQNWQSNSDVISRLEEQIAARLRGNLALHLLEAVDTGAAIRATPKQLSLSGPRRASCWPSHIPGVPELDLKRPSKGRSGPEPSEARARGAYRCCVRPPRRMAVGSAAGPLPRFGCQEFVACF